MATFDENKDGTIIVKLAEPIKLGDAVIDRVTLQKLRGKHLMHMPPLNSLGDYIALGARAVEPKGAVEEMSVEDACDIGRKVIEIVGKGSKAPAPASTTGAAGSE